MEIFGQLDFPLEKSKVTRGMKLEGWAFSSSEEDLDIEIFLDDHFIKTIHCGIPRYDIEKKFPNYKDNAYVSGFLAKLDMPKKSIYKYHTIEVIAKNKKISKSIAKIKIQLDTTDPIIKRESWPDQGMTINFKNGGLVFQQMQKLCNLKPNFRVLDLGCQLGRLALPFARFLDKNGFYDGVDIIPEAIEWTKNHIGKKYPNFNFTHADIYNGWYNPGGKVESHEYQLPFGESTFDFVIMISVFTHMLENDLKNYFSEISRVMKKGGLAWITFYLINEETLKLLDSKSTSIDFKYRYEPGYRSIRDDNPESSVAWEEGIVKEVCKKNGFEIIEPIHYGNWRYANDQAKRTKTLSIQDIILLRKI